MLVEVDTNATMSSVIVEMIFITTISIGSKLSAYSCYTVHCKACPLTRIENEYILTALMAWWLARLQPHTCTVEFWNSGHQGKRRKTKYLEQMPIKPKLLG